MFCCNSVDFVNYLLISGGKSENNNKIVYHFLYFRELVYTISLERMSTNEVVACKNSRNGYITFPENRHYFKCAVTHSVYKNRSFFGFKPIPAGLFFCYKREHLIYHPEFKIGRHNRYSHHIHRSDRDSSPSCLFHGCRIYHA